MNVLLTLLACGSGEPTHDAHSAEPAPHGETPVAPHGEPHGEANPEPAEPHTAVVTGVEPAPHAEPHAEPPVAHAPPAEAEAHPVEAERSEPEPVVSEDTEASVPAVSRRAARILLRPLLFALPVLVGIRLLGSWLRRRLSHFRSALFLAELGVLSVVLLWVVVRMLGLLESVSLSRPDAVILGLLGVAALPVVLRLVGHFRGLWLITSGTLRVGDTIETETISGTIHRIGLLQLTLIGEEGEPIIVRYDALSTDAIRVSSQQSRAPVELWVEGPVEEATLRSAVLLSPYRRAGTPVEVTLEPTGRARVRMVLWSPDVEAEARALLQGR